MNKRQKKKEYLKSLSKSSRDMVTHCQNCGVNIYPWLDGWDYGLAANGKRILGIEIHFNKSQTNIGV
jgi:hypothetical protein